MKKRGLCLLLLAVLLLSLAGCGSGNTDTAPADTGAGWSEQATDNQAADSPAEDTTSPATQALQNAKIIRTGNMDLQTQTFDETDTFLRTLTEQQGGYLEASSVSGEPGSRYAEYTVRVPQEGYDAFFTQVGEQCHVLYSASQSENITEQYVDVETRLSALRTKHERLLALLEQAGTMETIIALESELADTEYEIERLTGSLRQYDSLVSFSTIYLTVQETASLDPVAEGNSFVSELGQALRRGAHGVAVFLRGLVLFCATLWPLLVLAAAALAVVFYLRRRKKKTAPSPQLPPTDAEPPQPTDIPPDDGDNKTP